MSVNNFLEKYKKSIEVNLLTVSKLKPGDLSTKKIITYSKNITSNIPVYKSAKYKEQENLKNKQINDIKLDSVENLTTTEEIVFVGDLKKETYFNSNDYKYVELKENNTLINNNEVKPIVEIENNNTLIDINEVEPIVIIDESNKTIDSNEVEPIVEIEDNNTLIDNSEVEPIIVVEDVNVVINNDEVEPIVEIEENNTLIDINEIESIVELENVNTLIDDDEIESMVELENVNTLIDNSEVEPIIVVEDVNVVIDINEIEPIVEIEDNNTLIDNIEVGPIVEIENNNALIDNIEVGPIVKIEDINVVIDNSEVEPIVVVENIIDNTIKNKKPLILEKKHSILRGDIIGLKKKEEVIIETKKIEVISIKEKKEDVSIKNNIDKIDLVENEFNKIKNINKIVRENNISKINTNSVKKTIKKKETNFFTEQGEKIINVVKKVKESLIGIIDKDSSESRKKRYIPEWTEQKISQKKFVITKNNLFENSENNNQKNLNKIILKSKKLEVFKNICIWNKGRISILIEAFLLEGFKEVQKVSITSNHLKKIGLSNDEINDENDDYYDENELDEYSQEEIDEAKEGYTYFNPIAARINENRSQNERKEREGKITNYRKTLDIYSNEEASIYQKAIADFLKENKDFLNEIKSDDEYLEKNEDLEDN